MRLTRMSRGLLVKSFCQHRRDSIHWQYRCFDRILLNGLIQPLQQPIAGLLSPVRADRQIDQQKRSHLDASASESSMIIGAVGLKVA